MSRPLGRRADAYACLLHGDGALTEGATLVRAHGAPAARTGDGAICGGPQDIVYSGASSVLVEGLPAARVGDLTLHGGVVLGGAPLVFVGGPTFSLPPNLVIEGGPRFRHLVMRDLFAIWSTPTGRALLESIGRSERHVAILYFPKNKTEADDRTKACKHPGTGKYGPGTDSVIYYDPLKTTLYEGKEDWQTRPAAIGLGHELVHAEQNAYGAVDVGLGPNDGKQDKSSPWLPETKEVRELEATGVPPYDQYPFNENKLRNEWSPRQPPRKWY